MKFSGESGVVETLVDGSPVDGTPVDGTTATEAQGGPVAAVPGVVVLKVVEEETLSVELRAALYEMFPKHWQEIAGNGPQRAWTQMAPTWRVLAFDKSGVLLGQAGLVRVSDDAPVIGISDVVVGEEFRGHHVAARMLTEACWFADGEALQQLIDTGNPGLRRFLTRLGFQPVADQAVLVRDGVRSVPENWMCRHLRRFVELSSNF